MFYLIYNHNNIKDTRSLLSDIFIRLLCGITIWWVIDIFKWNYHLPKPQSILCANYAETPVSHFERNGGVAALRILFGNDWIQYVSDVNRDHYQDFLNVIDKVRLDNAHLTMTNLDLCAIKYFGMKYGYEEIPSRYFGAGMCNGDPITYTNGVRIGWTRSNDGRAHILAELERVNRLHSVWKQAYDARNGQTMNLNTVNNPE